MGRPAREEAEGSVFTTLSYEDAVQTAARLQQQLHAAAPEEGFFKLKVCPLLAARCMAQILCGRC